MEYSIYLKSKHWKELKSIKANKKNRIPRCGICGSTNNIDLHHLNYKNLYDVDTSDLRFLCRRCHFLAHKLYKEKKIIFRNNNHHSRFEIIKAKVKKYLGITHVNMFVNFPS